MLAATVSQRRARGQFGPERPSAMPSPPDAQTRPLSARPIWNSRGSEFCFGVFWRYREGRQGHFLPAHKSMWSYRLRLRPNSYCQ
eukprot:scaffold3854_cov107-Isochrysis_galbana.AAC.1